MSSAAVGRKLTGRGVEPAICIVAADGTLERRPEQDLLGVMSLMRQSRRIERYRARLAKSCSGMLAHRHGR